MTVLEALQALENGTEQGGNQFDWNLDFIHGYAGRDIAGVLHYRGHSRMTWMDAHSELEALADAGIVRVVVGNGRVPLYRTVGA
jgi:hypothetical protein